MSAGQLRNKVNIEQSTTTVSNNGDRSKPTWSTFKSVWAGFKFLTGSEDSYQRDSTLGKAEITIRYIDGVTTKMRVNRGGDIYDIEDITPKYDRKKYLILHCVQSNK